MSVEKLSILIIDDEDEIRSLVFDLVNEILEFPLMVLEARDGHEALNKMRNQKFNLIITDLKMPKLDGPALFKSLPYLDAKFIPDYILILSGLIPPAKNKLTVGRVTHFRKPLLAMDLRAYLEKIFPTRIKST